MNMYSEDIFTSKGFGEAKNVEPNFRSLLAEWIFIHAKAKATKTTPPTPPTKRKNFCFYQREEAQAIMLLKWWPWPYSGKSFNELFIISIVATFYCFASDQVAPLFILLNIILLKK